MAQNGKKNVFCIKVGDITDFTDFTDYANFIDYQPLLGITILMALKLLTLATFFGSEVAEFNDFSHT